MKQCEKKSLKEQKKLDLSSENWKKECKKKEKEKYIKVIEWTRFLCRKLKRGIIQQKNVSGVTNSNIYKMAGHT